MSSLSWHPGTGPQPPILGNRGVLLCLLFPSAGTDSDILFSEALSGFLFVSQKRALFLPGELNQRTRMINTESTGIFQGAWASLERKTTE